MVNDSNDIIGEEFWNFVLFIYCDPFTYKEVAQVDC